MKIFICLIFIFIVFVIYILFVRDDYHADFKALRYFDKNILTGEVKYEDRTFFPASPELVHILNDLSIPNITFSYKSSDSNKNVPLLWMRLNEILLNDMESVEEKLKIKLFVSLYNSINELNDFYDFVILLENIKKAKNENYKFDNEMVELLIMFYESVERSSLKYSILRD